MARDEVGTEVGNEFADEGAKAKQAVGESQQMTFRVVCVWCGGLIRLDDSEDANGMCLDCFYQILHEHALAQPQTDPLAASDR